MTDATVADLDDQAELASKIETVRQMVEDGDDLARAAAKAARDGDQALAAALVVAASGGDLTVKRLRYLVRA